MKAICEGRSTKSQVVQQSLEQYREVYVRTRQQMEVLKDVSGAFSRVKRETITVSSHLHVLD